MTSQGRINSGPLRVALLGGLFARGPVPLALFARCLLCGPHTWAGTNPCQVGLQVWPVRGVDGVGPGP